MSNNSFIEKLLCAERELKFLIRVYARRVEQGTMMQRHADREIALMTSIVEDFRQLAAKERLL